MVFLHLLTKRKLGTHTEQLACDYLKKQGLVYIEKNYTSRRGEIDLIMRDKNTVVFVEVRYRKSDVYGSALESITWRKQQRIIHTAKNYLARFHLTDQWPCRFDIVSICGNLQSPEIEWIPHAFDE